ncbi:unnamed protein product [Arctogadus glacialis]
MGGWGGRREEVEVEAIRVVGGNGVAALLQKELNHPLISIHCVAHAGFPMCIVQLRQFIKDKGLGGKISIQQVKRKWENLTAKYKDLRKPQSGVGTEDGKATAASWKWYSEMDGILGLETIHLTPGSDLFLRPGCRCGHPVLGAMHLSR